MTQIVNLQILDNTPIVSAIAGVPDNNNITPPNNARVSQNDEEITIADNENDDTVT